MNWYSAKELAGLPGMPGTVQGVKAKANTQRWEAQKRMGRGGGYEYAFAVLPKETQNALLLAQADNAAPTPTSTVAPQPEEQRPGQLQLTDAQRQVMGARVAFVREIERMSKMVSQQRAIETLVAHAQADDLTPYLKQRVVLANDRKTETRTLSERTLKRWIADFRKHGERGLAPKRRKADMSMPPWAGDFLKRYQKPQKPSVEAAYQLLVEQTEPPHPSIHQVRRWLAKLSPEARERGRRSPQELKALKSFNRLTSDHLLPNDVWVADGHKFDAEVIDPRTGKPFRPEITTCLDWRTRRVVGYAINVAESALATLDMLKMGIGRCGMFRQFYVDNGSGFDNAQVREVIDRLGGDMTNALPYNSQARGLIERSHRSVLVRLAKEFDSYIGADMDKHAGTRIHRVSRKALKAGQKPAEIPTLEEFWPRLAKALDAYNDRPHSSLPKCRDPETGTKRHQTPNEAWEAAIAEGFQPLIASWDLTQALTRPQEVRTTHRGEVRINSHTYFLRELELLHGEQVRVAWDYRDAKQVGIFSLEGVWIGEAMIEGNARRVFSKLELDEDRRIHGQLARLGDKGKTLTGKDVEIRVIEPVSQASEQQQERKIAHARAQLKQLEAQGTPFQLPHNKVERWRLWNKLDAQLKRGEDVPAEAREWHEIYRDNRDLKAIAEAMDTDGRPPVRNPWAK